MANTVICTAMAEAFREAADALEGSQDMDYAAREYAKSKWQCHKRVVFNGDCYSEEWAAEAKKRGLPELRGMVDAIGTLETEKTAALFESHRVLSRRELQSRAEVLYESYAKRLRIEARVMLHMVGKDYIPAVIGYLGKLDRSEPVQRQMYEKIAGLLAQVSDLREDLERQTNLADGQRAAKLAAEAFRSQVVPVMTALRTAVDNLEMLVGRQYWPVPTYGDLMFEV
jgi:glutamine synthetase